MQIIKEQTAAAASAQTFKIVADLAPVRPAPRDGPGDREHTVGAVQADF